AGHALLDLQAARKHVDQPRDLAQSDYLVGRQVRDVGLAEKRQHMMFAEAEKFDVLHHNHLIVIYAERRAVEDVIHILMVAAGEKLQRLLKTFWSLAQSFAVRIFAYQTDDFSHVT